MYTINGAVHSQLSPEALRQNLNFCVLDLGSRHEFELIWLHGAICKSPGGGFDLGSFRQTGLDGPRGRSATVLDHELIIRELVVAVQENETVALLQGVFEEDLAASQKGFLGLLLLEDSCTFRNAEQTSVGLWVIAVLHVVSIGWGVRVTVFEVRGCQRHLLLREKTCVYMLRPCPPSTTDLGFLRTACLFACCIQNVTCA